MINGGIYDIIALEGNGQPQGIVLVRNCLKFPCRLFQQPDYQTARKYWNKLKERLKKEGSESVTNCHQLKLETADGKKYLTDVTNPETFLRIIQSVPSPKAEPIKLWLARVGYERIQDMSNPDRSLDRARDYWKQHGRSEKWIQQRMMGFATNNLRL